MGRVVEPDYVLIQADVLSALKDIENDTFHAIITDPPYGLTSQRKGGSGVASVNPKHPAGRSLIGTGNGAGGFMGMSWDSGIPGVPFWSEFLRVSKPGAYLVAFGGSRTFHRMACAIEDAGWEYRDTLMWLYGQGFPHGHNIHELGEGSCLKPCYEPLVLARKPFKGTLEQCRALHGTGTLSIDACRLDNPEGSGPRSGEPSAEKRYTDEGATNFANKPGPRNGAEEGRWPPNLILDEEAAALLDAQTGILTSGKADVLHRNTDKFRNVYSPFAGQVVEGATYGDSGGASRFFYCPKASRAEKEAGLSGHTTRVTDGRAKTVDNAYQRGATERLCAHPTVKPIELMRWLVRLVTRPGDLVLDGFMGSGTTGISCLLEGRNFVGIEREEPYVKIATQRIEAWKEAMK